MAKKQLGVAPSGATDAATKGYVDTALGGTPTTVGKAVITAADAAAARTATNAVGKGELVINFADYGVCNGTTDDAGAFATALSVLSAAGGGTLQLPPKSIALTLTATRSFTIPANTRIVGPAGATKLLLSTNGGATDFRLFANTSGNNITFDGVALVRQSDYTLVFLQPGGCDGFHLRNCVLDGRFDIYPTNYAMGLDLSGAGAKSNITVKGSKFTNLWFGLMYDSAKTHTVDTIVVDDCTFSRNNRSDLEFNAPNSIMKNVSVTNSRFLDNQCAIYSNGGWGVGFAHVTGGSVVNCHFENNQTEAIHIEDDSTNITVTGNRIVTAGSAASGGGIGVQTNSSEIVIANNVFDNAALAQSNFAIGVQIGTTDLTTPGGRTPAVPHHVVISDNIIDCGAVSRGIYLPAAKQVTVTGNQITGAGVVSAGVYNYGNPGDAIICYGTDIILANNTLKGFRYGMSGAENTANTLGNPGTATGNNISHCYVGIHAASPGAMTITGNKMSTCVRPIVVGEAGYTAQPCTVTGNFATGCTCPMDIGGRLTLIRSSPGYLINTGTDKALYVDDNLLKLPVGAVITFPSGAVMTVTTAVTTSRRVVTGVPVPVTGTVSVSSILATDLVGTITNLAHSTTTANNYVSLASNTDTVAGVYTIQSSEIAATLAGKTLTTATLTSPTITTPTGIVKNDVGLGNVDNTSDANKPVSAATQTALDGKLFSPTVTATKTTAYTASVSEVVMCDATSAGFTVTLPTNVADKSRIIVKKIDSSVNVVTVAVSGTDVFNSAGSGVTTLTLPLTNQALTAQYSLSAKLWIVINTDIPLIQTDARYIQPSTADTLTNKTLTTPKIDYINGSNGGYVAAFTSVGGGYNCFSLSNGALGNPAVLSTFSVSTDTSVGLKLVPLKSGVTAVSTLTAASGVQSMLALTPTINQTSTAGYSALLVNPTETATGSGTKLLADFQLGGVSKAKIDTTGNLTASSYIPMKTTTSGTTLTLTSTSSAVQEFTNSSAATLNLPTTGVVAGQTWTVMANGASFISVYPSSGGGGLTTVSSGQVCVFTARIDSPTANADWLYLSALTTANTIAQRDFNSNLFARNFIGAKASTATAAGTTTLTIASSPTQEFTGSTTQTVTLPTTSVVAGMSYTIINSSTGLVTVQSSGANTITTIPAGSSNIFLARIDTPTTAANWILCGIEPSVLDNDELTTGESTIHRRMVNISSVTVSGGQLRLAYFTARKTETITQVRVPCGAVAGVGATLARVGVYSVASNGDLTLVASTANDTTLWIAAATSYTRSLSASFTKVKGQRYAVGYLVVGVSTAPQFYGAGYLLTAETAIAPRLAGLVVSLSDLPSSVTTASGLIIDASTHQYAVLLP